MKHEGKYLATNLSLKGWKAVKIQLKENELIVELKAATKSKSHLKFKGVIGLVDFGFIGKALRELTFDNKGSFKVMSVLSPGNKLLFVCECMEAQYTHDLEN